MATSVSADCSRTDCIITNACTLMPLTVDSKNVPSDVGEISSINRLCLLLSGNGRSSPSLAQTYSRISRKSPKMKHTSIAGFLRKTDNLESAKNGSSDGATASVPNEFTQMTPYLTSIPNPGVNAFLLGLNVQDGTTTNTGVNFPVSDVCQFQCQDVQNNFDNVSVSDNYITINLKELPQEELNTEKSSLSSDTMHAIEDDVKVLDLSINTNVTSMDSFSKICLLPSRSVERGEIIALTSPMKRRKVNDHDYSTTEHPETVIIKIEDIFPDSPENTDEEISWSHVQIEESDSSLSDADESCTTDVMAPKYESIPKQYYLKELWKSYKHSSLHVSSETQSMWKDPNCNCRATKEDLDLANALGISSEALDPERIAERKLSIQRVISSLAFRSSNASPFTIYEEFDVHCRAEAYGTSIVPDPDYYIVRGTMPILTSERTTTSQLWAFNGRGRKRKRNKESLLDVASIVHNEEYPFYMNCITLADGTQLLKPTAKLVELVAQALNDSPDGMLQVQQVYMVLQKKYPYFQHFDKASLTSWKSSIRHALYQKWFHKVYFSTDFICVRGCYWAINRAQTPKDWSLPPPSEETPLPFEPEFQVIRDENWFSPTEPVLDNEQVLKDLEYPETGTLPYNSLSTYLTDSSTEAQTCGRNLSEDFIMDNSKMRIPGSECSGLDFKADPDPILNDLNNMTQSTECGDKILDIDGDSQHMSYSDDNWSPDSGSSDELHSANLASLGLLPALTKDGQTQDLDLYVPLSSELPFYIALPTDESVEIFNDS